MPASAIPPGGYAVEDFPSAEEYLQRLVRQDGFIAAAAIAYLFREVREGYIDTDIPVDAYISWSDLDGHFYVEIADGPPVPAQNYRCRERSRSERADYLHERDQLRIPRGAGWAPLRAARNFEPSGEQQPAAAPDTSGKETPEAAPAVDEEPPKPAPMASVGEAPLKTGSVEFTEAMRQQGALQDDITEWLLKDKTRTASGKQVLDANSMRYRASCEKRFPGVRHNELKRALLAARDILDLVKPRPYQKGQSRAKRPRKET